MLINYYALLRATKCASDSADNPFNHLNIIYCHICIFVHPLVSAAVGLESLAAQRVAAARPVPGSWMVRRPDKEASLML